MSLAALRVLVVIIQILLYIIQIKYDKPELSIIILLLVFVVLFAR